MKFLSFIYIKDARKISTKHTLSILCLHVLDIKLNWMGLWWWMAWPLFLLWLYSCFTHTGSYILWTVISFLVFSLRKVAVWNLKLALWFYLILFFYGLRILQLTCIIVVRFRTIHYFYFSCMSLISDLPALRLWMKLCIWLGYLINLERSSLFCFNGRRNLPHQIDELYYPLLLILCFGSNKLVLDNIHGTFLDEAILIL